MKRKLTGFFFGAVLATAVAFFGTAVPCYAEEYTANDITYVIDTESCTATVSGYGESLSGNIVIPEKIEVSETQYLVTSVDDGAFAGCSKLEGAFIPEATTLGTDVFLDTSDSLNVCRYRVTENASESLDGKTHVELVSVQDKDGNVISDFTAITANAMGSGYVIDGLGKGSGRSATSYDVWVAGTQVSSQNAADVLGAADEGATVTYDADTKTLTLNNANIEVDDGSHFVIYAEQDLTIALVGSNNVTLGGYVEISELAWESTIAGGYIVPEPAAPIACKGGSLTVQSAGSNRGSLTATSDAGIESAIDNGSLMSAGIVATGTIRIENAEVAATGCFIYANDDIVKSSYGIFAGQGVIVNNADVFASGDEATWCAGIYALTGNIDLNGHINALGGRAVSHTNPYSAFSSGVYASEGVVNVTGGIVVAAAASLTEGGAAYGVFGSGGISITGGEVYAIGATSNVDGVDPIFGAGLYSSVGDIAISGASTQVEADGGFANSSIAGIYANAGNVLITDANVKASAQHLYGAEDGTAVSIYAGSLQIARSNPMTGNVILRGADVQAVGLTDSVRFSGSLTVAPANGMRYSVDALKQALWGYPDPLWDDMAAAAQSIQGSPFEMETPVDNALVSGSQYLHFYNVEAVSEIDPGDPSNPATPEDPNISEDPDVSEDPGVSEDPDVSENPDEPNSPDTDSSDTEKIPATGESNLISPLGLVACSALLLVASMMIRKRSC